MRLSCEITWPSAQLSVSSRSMAARISCQWTTTEFQDFFLNWWQLFTIAYQVVANNVTHSGKYHACCFRAKLCRFATGCMSGWRSNARTRIENVFRLHDLMNKVAMVDLINIPVYHTNISDVYHWEKLLSGLHCAFGWYCLIRVKSSSGCWNGSFCDQFISGEWSECGIPPSSRSVQCLQLPNHGWVLNVGTQEQSLIIIDDWLKLHSIKRSIVHC